MSTQAIASHVDHTPPAAWRMLALGVTAQASGTLLISTPAYLIPLLHLERGMPLAQAGLIAAAPTFGMMLTLVIWGALADRHGERWVIAGGLALTSACAVAAAQADGHIALGILLALGGAAAASTNAASGRVVVGWFPRSRRGLAMGIRQMSQPLGVAVAALVVPALAQRHGTAAPLWVAAAATAALAAACAVGVADPPRPPAAAGAIPTGNPYTSDGFLLRIHLVSALLVVPQFALSTFGLMWLIAGLGWSATAAGVVMAIAQLVGALGRLAVGALSDRVASRVRVLRWVAVSAVAAMLTVALTGGLHWSVAAGVTFVFATMISVADNGVAFTSVAEAAGPTWSGKALGIQNSGQYLAASAVSPVVGVLVTAVGYPLAFALVALAPLASIGLVPTHDRSAE